MILLDIDGALVDTAPDIPFRVDETSVPPAPGQASRDLRAHEQTWGQALACPRD